MATLLRIASAFDICPPQPAAAIASRCFLRDSRYGWPAPIHGGGNGSAEYAALEAQWRALHAQLNERCQQLADLWAAALAFDVRAALELEGVEGAIKAQAADVLAGLRLEAECEQLAAQLHAVRRQAEAVCGIA